MTERLCNLIPYIGGGKLKEIDDTLKGMINLIYPVGSYYWSSNATNPGTLFGVGTWEQIKDKFVYAAGSKTVGSTGGEETHKLTTGEMPSHQHTFIEATGVQSHTLTVNEIPSHHHDANDWSVGTSKGFSNIGRYALAQASDGQFAAYATLKEVGHSNSNYNTTNTGGSTGHNHGLSTHSQSASAVGSGNVHNNMPPYKGTYFWTRTA